MKKKVALSVGVFILLLVSGEVLFHFISRSWAPVFMTEGYYFGNQKLVNGYKTSIQIQIPRELSSLPEEKAPGEVRIFVFGESSVMGSPWGPMASFSRMLKDLLTAAFPERLFTVVNMGVAGAMSMDLHYYIIASARYHPDISVVYSGFNDEFGVAPEMCLPFFHPHIHSALSWLAGHSDFMWGLRARGPSWLAGLRGEGHSDYQMEQRSECSSFSGFRTWTEILLDDIISSGARPIVVTPIEHSLYQFELQRMNTFHSLTSADYLNNISGSYKGLLSCITDCLCNPDQRLLKLLDEAILPHSLSQVPFFDIAEALVRGIGSLVHPDMLAGRVLLWEQSARDRGAGLINFGEQLRQSSGWSCIGPSLVVDEVHLRPRSNLLLAHLLTREIAEVLDLPVPEIPKWQDLDGSGYVPDQSSSMLVAHGLKYLNNKFYFIGLSIMRLAAEMFDDPAARDILEWFSARLSAPGQEGASWEDFRDGLIEAGRLNNTLGADPND